MDPNPSFIFSSSCSPQFYKPSIYNLPIPSCVLASYHPLLKTWTSKFDRTPRGPRYLRRVDPQTEKRASCLANRKDAKQLKREKRGDKNEKKNRRREPPPLSNKVPAEGVDSFLSCSSADSGFQDDHEKVTFGYPGGVLCI